MNLFLCLFAFLSPDQQPYSRVMVHPDQPTVLRLNPARGCLVIFNQPFVDTWSSDGGEYFSYKNWGTEDVPNTMVIIKNTLETDEAANLFFLFEGNTVVELVLTLTKAEGAEDRIMRVTVPLPLPALKTIARPAKEDPTKERAMAAMMRSVNKIETPHGTLHYNFSQAPYFLYFEQKPDSPPITTLEVVKAKKRLMSRTRFKYEIPVMPVAATSINGQPFQFFPIQALSNGEHYYLRLQARGERLPVAIRLRKVK